MLFSFFETRKHTVYINMRISLPQDQYLMVLVGLLFIGKLKKNMCIYSLKFVMSLLKIKPKSTFGVP